MKNNFCYFCSFCSFCSSCSSCNFCSSCSSCSSCNYCYFCIFCYSCNYCYFCIFCYSCNYSKNLKMTEYNIFCYSEKYNYKDSFQQKRYRAFNKEVGEQRYNEIKTEVETILKCDKKLKLNDFWKQVTQEQWRQLLAIPEAKDFKEGFEYISGQKILDDKVKVVTDSKTVYISRGSAEALGLI